jgi:hypothetical protein
MCLCGWNWGWSLEQCTQDFPYINTKIMRSVVVKEGLMDTSIKLNIMIQSLDKFKRYPKGRMALIHYL